MKSIKEIGVVVVGLGIAGQVRVRDLKEQKNGLVLRGVVSRRLVSMEDVASMTFEDALSRNDVQALLICTEPGLHEEYIERGLQHNKHILVEYPLAKSARKAEEFHQIAEQKGLVLWEENVALLTDFHKAVKAKAATVGITSVKYSVKGRYNGWVENFDDSGLPFISCISSIQTVMDVVGTDLNVVGASFDKDEEHFSATAKLESRNHCPVEISLIRTAETGVKRSKLVIYEFEDGETLDSTKLATQPPQKQGLFMQDLDKFYQALQSGKTPSESRNLTIQSLETAEKIHSLF